ncbi:cellular nucleic acid-binding protein-like [Pseudomyrmex gracilis]|uniref:cellular nucleic acid-binding protein-like n=1 Tax=Pseudomyrmex gracilis TaxID=219809 RepID=UPI0009955387|nr:cellular nucleic acid-binding protein-like [Pseudomyrmex gracilis]
MGFDSTVTPKELVEAVARGGGCAEEQVRIKTIRTTPAGRSACWAQCPLAAARKLGMAKRVQVGEWFSVSVEVLLPRRLRCHRCLCTGHVRRHCSSAVDCSGLCYRCGAPGHGTRACSAKEPRCPLCSNLKVRANHRLGGASVPPQA